MSNTTTPAYIIGAGLTGLIAAHAWPSAKIIEKAPEPPMAHRALLRFRSDAVARLTGVEFRKVRVRKGIYFENEFMAPSIRLANLYSAKVLEGRMESDRSIWNLDPVDRYVAPDSFHEQLIDAVNSRLVLGWDVMSVKESSPVGLKPVVSTIPLPVMLEASASYFASTHIDFFRAPIVVQRFRVPKADVFQTVYFPEPELAVYRASMTGDTLIVESVAADPFQTDHVADLDDIVRAFGITDNIEEVERVEQRYGKIAPIHDATRRELLFRLTQDYKVYSLGRFAIWKNILLDDVVQDIDVIKRLMKSGSAYDHRRAT